jgi:hypothetical protein
MRTAHPAHGLLSADRLGRIQGSCYLAVGDSAKGESILESTECRLQGRHKSKAIILGNLALAHVRQRDIDQAATVLHRAIDLLEVSRGGGGLNVVPATVCELRPWRQERVVQSVHERPLALMTLNYHLTAQPEQDPTAIESPRASTTFVRISSSLRTRPSGVPSRTGHRESFRSIWTKDKIAEVPALAALAARR